MSAWQALRAPVLPAAPRLPAALDRPLAWLLAAFGFLLPFSVAGVSLSMAALLLLAAAALPQVWRSAPWREPVMATGLLLLVYIALHTLWVEGWTAAAVPIVNRYHELLMAPILFALFRLVSRPDAFLRGLAAGALLYAALHWAALGSPALAAYLDPRRISAGFALALCAFILLEQARGGGKLRWAWRAAALFLAATVLFTVGGRTGHVVLLVLLGWAAWLHGPKRWRWIAAVVVPAVALGLGMSSAAMQKRIGETTAALTQPHVLADTSSGIRVQLMRHGLALGQQHFAAGAGFGRYADIHEAAVRRHDAAAPSGAPLAGAHWVRTSNPHNEYLMQLVGGGIVALALFLAWLLLPLLRRHGSAGADPVLVAAVLAFAIGCLFNSLLMDFVEGHFHAALLAWLLARQPVGAQAAA